MKPWPARFRGSTDTCFWGSRDLCLPVEAGSLGRDPDKTRVCVEKPERETQRQIIWGKATGKQQKKII